MQREAGTMFPASRSSWPMLRRADRAGRRGWPSVIPCGIFRRMEATWTEVDEYFAQQLAPPDDVLTEALAASAAAGLPPISVTAPQGKLLHLLARMIGARRILEIGTLGGYSTNWFGRALPPDGPLVTLGVEPAFAAVARAEPARARRADRARPK